MTPEQLLNYEFIALLVILFGIFVWTIYDITKRTKENKAFRQTLKVGYTCLFIGTRGEIVEINETDNTVKIQKIVNIKDIYKK